MVDDPQHPERAYVIASSLVALVVLAALVFALIMAIRSFG